MDKILKEAIISIIDHEYWQESKRTHKDDRPKLDKNYKRALNNTDAFITDLTADINSSLRD